MPEQVLPQVPAQEHLHVHGLPGEAHHHDGLQQDGPQVGQGKEGQAVQRVRLDKVLDGVLLEQGDGHVDDGGEAVDGDHGEDDGLVPGQYGQQPFPDVQIEVLGVFLLVKGGHQASPPSWMSARSSLLI